MNTIQEFGVMNQKNYLTARHPLPVTAARSILGPDHPQEGALVVLLREAYTTGYNDCREVEDPNNQWWIV